MSATITLTVMQEDEKRTAPSKRSLRLPTIAPKEDQLSSASSSRSRGAHSSGTTLTPKHRLPPRSRNGCWTCRQRKVKCDEGRPICGQCGRLGHTCDYSHRLIFRNDTDRVIDRMSEGVSTTGCLVWEGETDGLSSAPSSIGSPIDDLPPFLALTTDEDRERKAETASAGTFNVILNPDSFQHLPEYAEAGSANKPILSSRRASNFGLQLRTDTSSENIPVAGDENLVILSKFEDLTRRHPRDIRSPTSPSIPYPPRIKSEETSIDLVTALQTPEAVALKHFRDVVWKQIVPPEHEGDSSVILLDDAAKFFLPLVRAMVAVGLLGLSREDGNERLDSLQHYSAILPELKEALKSEQDLASDGAFLTHFLLLIYEIASADIEHQNQWTHHISTLLKVTLLRRSMYGAEKYPFLIWWICNIDLDALLSGHGSGTYVGYMLQNDLMPPPSFHLYPLGPDNMSQQYPEEVMSLHTVLQLDYAITIQAVKLGLLAHEFRLDTTFPEAEGREKAILVKLRLGQVADLQEQLRHLWTVPAVQEVCRIHLPPRSKRLLQRALTLYRACIIFSHTSMWRAQQADVAFDFYSEVVAATAQILQVARAAVPDESDPCRYLVFPLFMAGVASIDGHQTFQALELLRALERSGVGRSATTARRALEAIYEQKSESFRYTGHSLEVDWREIMSERQLVVVNFGL